MSQTSQQSKPKQKFLVVDCNEIIIAATSKALKEKYPQVEILTALNAQSAQSLVEQYDFYLVLLDLNLPSQPDSTANSRVGIELLQTLMQVNPAPNIAVSSTNIMSLVRVKPLINSYEGGFAARDKFLSIEEMFNLVDFALRGSICLPLQVRSHPEFDPKLIQMLTLKFEEGLTEQAIAQEMGISGRTLHNYWKRLGDALGIHNEPRKDWKIQIEIAARKFGLID